MRKIYPSDSKEKRKEYREKIKSTTIPSIYKLVCNKTNLIYVGSTTQKLYDRKGKHMWDYRNKTQITASKVIEGGDWGIHLIEEVPDKSQLKIREQYWIDTLDCVNISNCIKKFTKEHQKESDKRFRIKHRERLNNYSKYIRGYRKSWGGDWRYQNNLLLIDPTLFN